MWSKIKKFIAISFGIFVVLVIGLVIFLKIYVTPERVKGYLIPVAEDALQREVELGELDVSIFTGIKIKDFSIKEEDGKTDFVSTKDFILTYQFWPLLSGNVIIDEFRMVSPSVRVFRDKNGVFNFESLGKKDEKEEGVEKEEEEAEALPISLRISKLVFKDAKVNVTDQMREIPNVKAAFNLESAIKSLSEQELETEGNFGLSIEKLVLHDKAKKPLKDLEITYVYDLDIDFEKKRARIEKSELSFQEIPFILTGLVSNFDKDPDVDLQFEAPALDLAKVLKEVKPFVEMKGLAATGNISTDISVKGNTKKIENLVTKGSVDFKKINVKYNQLDAHVDGSIGLAKKTISPDMTFSIGKNAAHVKGSIKNYLEKPLIRMNVSSKELKLEELMVLAGGGKKEVSTTEPEPLNLNLTASGEVKIDRASYKELAIQDFYLAYEFRDNKLNLNKITASSANGEFISTSFIDLSKKGYGYNITANVKAVDADTLMKGLSPDSKVEVHGILSSDLKLKGAGTLTENIKKNLWVNAGFKLKNGLVKNHVLSDRIANFLQIHELKTMNLDRADGTLKVLDGMGDLVVHIASKDVKTDPVVKLGLMKETIHSDFDFMMSPELSKKAMLNAAIASLITNEGGWGRIPLKVRGTWENPSVKVDAGKATKRAAKKGVNKVIDEVFGTDKKEGEKKPGEKKNLEEEIGGALKKLFK